MADRQEGPDARLSERLHTALLGVDEAETADYWRTQVARLEEALSAKDAELAKVKSIIPWHRGDPGLPDVPVLQERYDSLRRERDRLLHHRERLELVLRAEIIFKKSAEQRLAAKSAEVERWRKALTSVMDDYVDDHDIRCYCGELIAGKCGLCLAREALAQSGGPASKAAQSQSGEKS